MTTSFAPDNCTRCPALVACRKQVVNGRGATGGVMFVGQNPDEYADRYGKPFIGRQGDLLVKLCEAAGIPASLVYRTNAVRCASPKNRRPKDDEIANCREYLIEEIKAVAPKVIVTLGEVPLTSLHAMDGPEQGAYAEAMAEWTEAMYTWERETADWTEARTSAGNKQPKLDTGEKWLKPKKPAKPKKPKLHKMALRDVSGHTLVQQETGILMVPSYHPSFLLRGHWDECALVIEHLKKAWRIANGQQTLGHLGDYATVRTIRALKGLRDYLLRDEFDTVWFDTETTGLDWQRDELLCISFTPCPGEGYVVPLLHNVGGGQLDWWWEGKTKKAIRILKQIFRSGKTKGGHNMLFDTRMLERESAQPWIEAMTAFGIKLGGKLVDTELEHHSIAETLPHNMTNVLAIHTDMPYYEDEVHAASDNKKHMAKVPDNILHFYSAADADGLPRIDESLMPIVRSEGVDWVLENVTYPMLRVCRVMEDNGIPINQDYFYRLCQFYDVERNRQQEAMYEAYPELGRFRWWYPGNPAAERSAGDLKDILFNKLELEPSGLATKSSRECHDCSRDYTCPKHDSVGKAALEAIYQESKHPILPMLKSLGQLKKMQGTYLDKGKGGWARHIRPDGRIHPSFQISKVETGRLAARQPSVQNPPKGIHIHPVGVECLDPKCKAKYADVFDVNSVNAFRDIIEAGPGKVILNVDWNQLEVWVLAYTLAVRYDDPTMLDILLSGEDIHTKVARFIWPEDPDIEEDWKWRAVHGDLRSKAKCMTPDTKVLTADLRWVPLSEVTAGDELIGFDEEVSASPTHRRRFKKTQVMAAFPAEKELYEVEFADGTVLRCTGDHPFLTDRGAPGKNRAWRTLETGLKRGIKSFEPWSEDTTKEAGWLAGFFDGEGCLTSSGDNGAHQLLVVQNKGLTNDKLQVLALARGYTPTTSIRSGHDKKQVQTTISGGRPDRWRFLGSIRPERLLRTFQERGIYGTVSGRSVEIVRVTPLGMGPVISIETTSRTFVAEGFLVHNTFVFGLAYGLTLQGIIDRLGCSEEEGKVLLDRYMQFVPGLKLYFADIRRQVTTDGFTENWFGRRRHSPSILVMRALGAFNDIEGCIREHINFGIQSGGSDLHSIASYLVVCEKVMAEALSKRGVRAILSVHDSLTFEVDAPTNEYVQQTAWMLKNVFEGVAKNLILRDGSRLGWQCLVEVEWGKTWGTPEWKLDSRGQLTAIEGLPEDDGPGEEEDEDEEEEDVA